MPQGQPMQGEMPPEQQMMPPQGMPNEAMWFCRYAIFGEGRGA
jgi:hypothetical protein